MQTILYEDAPYLDTTYDTIGEAYRSDRWEGFVPQPNPGGILLFQYGHANYLNVGAGRHRVRDTRTGAGVRRRRQRSGHAHRPGHRRRRCRRGRWLAVHA